MRMEGHIFGEESYEFSACCIDFGTIYLVQGGIPGANRGIVGEGRAAMRLASSFGELGNQSSLYQVVKIKD